MTTLLEVFYDSTTTLVAALLTGIISLGALYYSCVIFFKRFYQDKPFMILDDQGIHVKNNLLHWNTIDSFSTSRTRRTYYLHVHFKNGTTKVLTGDTLTKNLHELQSMLTSYLELYNADKPIEYTEIKYHPGTNLFMSVVVLIFGIAVGITSLNEIEKFCYQKPYLTAYDTGIMIKDHHLIPWSEIKGIQIITKKSGRISKTHVVITLTTGSELELDTGLELSLKQLHQKLYDLLEKNR